MPKPRIYTIPFATVYPLYVAKVKRKGRTQVELDTVLRWLTGYQQRSLRKQIDGESDLEGFFKQAPKINPRAKKITGVVCGVRVEELEDRLIKKIRSMDKLVDELAKGWPLEKILRT